MWPYLLLLAVISACGFFLLQHEENKKRSLLFLTLVSAMMFVMSTMRAESVGVDNSLYYLPYFKSVCEGGLEFLFSAQNSYRTEPGFSLLVYLLSLFGSSQVLFFGGISALTVGLTAAFAYRHASSVWLCIFTFVSFGFFGYTMCTIRQQLAICIAMFALPYLQKKKMLPYLAIVVIAALFHKSLWLMIPVYWLAWIPLNWKTVSLYGAGTLFALIFTDPILNFVTRFVFKQYTADNYYRALGRNFQTALIPILLFAIAMLLKKRLLARNPRNLPLINLSAYSCCLFILTLQTFIYQRVALVFLPVAVMLLPELVLCMKPSEEHLAELQTLQLAENGRRKQNSQRYVQLKTQIKDEKTMYYAAVGFALFGGWLYYLFLLVANRLLLTPYVTMFQV